NKKKFFLFLALTQPHLFFAACVRGGAGVAPTTSTQCVSPNIENSCGFIDAFVDDLFCPKINDVSNYCGLSVSRLR
ncbi:MAG: hypothetical protein ACK466_07840, partial [Pseudanabaena sp.]